MRNLSLLILLTAVGLLAYACLPAGPQQILFAELVENADLYDGKQVCTEGIRAAGFEVSGLGAVVLDSGGALYLAEPVIWLERARIEETGTCELFQGYSFCPVRACGVFRAGGGFGHVGGYAYQLGE